MEEKEIVILDMLSLIYEEMDIDVIEEKFVSLIADLFSFDRVGLFFVKHRKGVLKGKLCKGFDDGTISSIEVPIKEQLLLTRPLVTGFPLWGDKDGTDPFIKKIGLKYFALFPVINKKRISCWQIKECQHEDCPAHGNKYVRCWLVEGTKCCDDTKLVDKDKSSICENCEVFATQGANDVEGILLVDKADGPIDSNTITIISIIAHAVGIAINNSKAYSSALREAIFDDLTGLHNRRYFNERLVDELDRAKRYQTPISLLMCDIDHFKEVNDSFGHPVGDRVLTWVGKILRDKVRGSDIVARYGGEEFAVMLLSTSKDLAFTIAENLRKSIAKEPLLGDEGINITASIGVSTFLEDASSFEGLISLADKALYLAKTQGRNKVC